MISCGSVTLKRTSQATWPCLYGNLPVFRPERERNMQRETGMPCLLDNLRLLEAAQGYAALGLYMQSNRELEQMSPETRLWPEVLAIKLAIFDGLNLWEMVEIVALQLKDSARGHPQWISMAERARRQTHAARQRDKSGAGDAEGRATFA